MHDFISGLAIQSGSEKEGKKTFIVHSEGDIRKRIKDYHDLILVHLEEGKDPYRKVLIFLDCC